MIDKEALTKRLEWLESTIRENADALEEEIKAIKKIIDRDQS